jgi:hypothetical protein
MRRAFRPECRNQRFRSRDRGFAGRRDDALFERSLHLHIEGRDRRAVKHDQIGPGVRHQLGCLLDLFGHRQQLVARAADKSQTRGVDRDTLGQHRRQLGLRDAVARGQQHAEPQPPAISDRAGHHVDHGRHDSAGRTTPATRTGSPPDFARRGPI